MHGAHGIINAERNAQRFLERRDFMPDISEGDIKSLASDRANIVMTLHSNERCRQRGIRFSDIEDVLLNGAVIEQYPDDFPYPSCLMLGKAIDGRAVHVCCGLGEGKIWIITAYCPSHGEWESDFKTRKAVKS